MRKGKKPYFSLLLLLLIAGLCIFCEVTAPYTPQDMDSTAVSLSPQAGHLLGTDSMGRDLLSMLLYSGHINCYQTCSSCEQCAKVKGAPAGAPLDL